MKTGRPPTTRRGSTSGGREVRCRLSAAEYAAAEAMAAERGVTLPALVRELLLPAVASPDDIHAAGFKAGIETAADFCRTGGPRHGVNLIAEAKSEYKAGEALAAAIRALTVRA